MPDGVLRRDVVYHVAAVPSANSGLGLLITGLRVFYLQKEIPWNSSRFRKVDSLKGHVPMKRRKTEPKKQRVAVSVMCGQARNALGKPSEGAGAGGTQGEGEGRCWEDSERMIVRSKLL